MSLAQLTGKVALITGSSSGIGAATAVLFAKLGANLSLTGRNATALEETKKACTAAAMNPAQKFLVNAADVTNESDTKSLVEKTIQQLGQLDILVNCAGVLEYGTIENTTLEQYDRVMNGNVRSVYHLMMLAPTPYLISTKGSVVNVSSVNGLRSFPNVLAYNISKSAVDQLTRCTAIELAPKGVRVNAVNPGVIVTDLQKRGGLGDEAYNKFLEHSKTTHALGRVGEPDEVAEAIAYLASSNSSFVTGVTLAVDGGRHVLCPR
jgi:NAD(P)-dependent dehydrogenase (short-subunit alcohol dehydrogenase family)